MDSVFDTEQRRQPNFPPHGGAVELRKPCDHVVLSVYPPPSLSSLSSLFHLPSDREESSECVIAQICGVYQGNSFYNPPDARCRCFICLIAFYCYTP